MACINRICARQERALHLLTSESRRDPCHLRGRHFGVGSKRQRRAGDGHGGSASSARRPSGSKKGSPWITWACVSSRPRPTPVSRCRTTSTSWSKSWTSTSHPGARRFSPSPSPSPTSPRSHRHKNSSSCRHAGCVAGWRARGGQTSVSAISASRNTWRLQTGERFVTAKPAPWGFAVVRLRRFGEVDTLFQSLRKTCRCSRLTCPATSQS